VVAPLTKYANAQIVILYFKAFCCSQGLRNYIPISPESLSSIHLHPSEDIRTVTVVLAIVEVVEEIEGTQMINFRLYMLALL